MSGGSTNASAPPEVGVPAPERPVKLPIFTLISIDCFARFGKTWASSIQTLPVSVRSILPTMPFQLPASESETLCASGRYGMSMRLSTRMVSRCLPADRLLRS